jgi:hypothetical protein
MSFDYYAKEERRNTWERFKGNITLRYISVSPTLRGGTPEIIAHIPRNSCL